MNGVETPLTQNMRQDGEPVDLRAYMQAGGYEGLRKAVRMDPSAVTEMVSKSNLRGRGGAGFPTGKKWSFVPMGPDARRPKYFAVNADEMEPGTFKDRLLMEKDPHLLIEGAAIASYAIQADIAYIFLRWAYRKSEEVLRKALREAYDAGFLGGNVCGSDYQLEMYVHVSGGRYMCGEETGLLNALEGKRANPRAKPPYPGVSGLFGKPTVVQNVETVCNVPNIVKYGPDWFRGLSRTEDGGTKLYGASGKVKRPGLWEGPMGTPLGEILDHFGGMQDGHQLRGLLPGGASTYFLTPEQHLDLPMDFTATEKAGNRLGTGTMIILDDQTCPVGMMRNLQHFFSQESCGWCTPCWSGLGWTTKILTAMEQGDGIPEHMEQLRQMTRFMAPGNTYCTLAPGAMESLESGLKYFGEDFDRHIGEHRCPWKSA